MNLALPLSFGSIYQATYFFSISMLSGNFSPDFLTKRSYDFFLGLSICIFLSNAILSISRFILLVAIDSLGLSGLFYLFTADKSYFLLAALSFLIIILASLLLILKASGFNDLPDKVFSWVIFLISTFLFILTGYMVACIY